MVVYRKLYSRGKFRSWPSDYSNFRRHFVDSRMNTRIFHFDSYSDQRFKQYIRQNGFSQGAQRILYGRNAGGQSEISEMYSYERVYQQFGAILVKVKTKSFLLGHTKLILTVNLSFTEVHHEYCNKLSYILM